MDFTRCYGCMRELPAPGAVCPHCGYDNTNNPGKQPSLVLPCGTVLKGRYITGRDLGISTFDITYIAYDLVLENTVCIKEYFPHRAAFRSPEGRNTVLRFDGESARTERRNRQSFIHTAQEAVRLRDLRHMVAVWDAFAENDTAYIVMDYLEGETLRKRLDRNSQRKRVYRTYDAGDE